MGRIIKLVMSYMGVAQSYSSFGVGFVEIMNIYIYTFSLKFWDRCMGNVSPSPRMAILVLRGTEDQYSYRTHKSVDIQNIFIKNVMHFCIIMLCTIA